MTTSDYSSFSVYHGAQGIAEKKHWKPLVSTDRMPFSQTFLVRIMIYEGSFSLLKSAGSSKSSALQLLTISSLTTVGCENELSVLISKECRQIS